LFLNKNNNINCTRICTKNERNILENCENSTIIIVYIRWYQHFEREQFAES